MAKMPSRKVTTVSGNDEFVRLDIYEGRIPLGEAGDRLLELALADHARGSNHLSLMLECICAAQHQAASIDARLATLTLPWPVRWWKWLAAELAKRRAS